MIRPWLVMCLVLGIASVSSIPVVSQSAPGDVSFSKTVEAGTFTVEVSGMITIDPSTRALSGTISVVVKDDDVVIAERTIEFSNAAGSAEALQDIVIEEAGVAIHVSVDPLGGGVGVSVEILPGEASRRRP